MSIGFIFWLLMILVLLFGGWRGYADPGGRYFVGVSFLLWVLLFLLGWKVFGFIVQG